MSDTRSAETLANITAVDVISVFYQRSSKFMAWWDALGGDNRSEIHDHVKKRILRAVEQLDKENAELARRLDIALQFTTMSTIQHVDTLLREKEQLTTEVARLNTLLQEQHEATDALHNTVNSLNQRLADASMMGINKCAEVEALQIENARLQKQVSNLADALNK